MIIIGTNETAIGLADTIRERPFMGLEMQGFVASDNSQQESGPDILGSLDKFKEIAAEIQPDAVYIATPMSDHGTIDNILRVLGDSTVSIFLVPDLYTADIMQGKWVAVGDTPTVSVIDAPSRGINLLLKRLEDIVISSILLLILAVPMLAIALCVRLSSAGPAIYKQVRYGVRGKPIIVFKFRTMNVMESSELFVQAKKNDHRVTAFGAFLRKTSLDELPQLINVLQGHMSIVGPRPHPVALNEKYRSEIVGYMLRHKVKPGITGLAQIHGYRGETETPEKMQHRIRYDIEYIHNWTIWLDIAIILRTPWSLISNKDVY